MVNFVLSTTVEIWRIKFVRNGMVVERVEICYEITFCIF